MAHDQQKGKTGVAYSLFRNEPITAVMLKLQEDKGITNFVETGTRKGRGVVWAATHGFDPCYTIDINSIKLEGDFARLVDDDIIFSHVGNSPDVLKGLLPWVDWPAIFWLDAHDPRVRTPILEEIAAILAWGEPAYIFIDNITVYARGRFYDDRFVQWQQVEEIYEALGERPRFERADVLVSFPEGRGEELIACREVARDTAWFLEE